jgi:hypothetical protein
MMKRIFGSVAMALALFAISSATPQAASASIAVSEQEQAATPCLIYCLSCETHHVVDCPATESIAA